MVVSRVHESRGLQAKGRDLAEEYATARRGPEVRQSGIEGVPPEGDVDARRRNGAGRGRGGIPGGGQEVSRGKALGRGREVGSVMGRGLGGVGGGRGMGGMPNEANQNKALHQWAKQRAQGKKNKKPKNLFYCGLCKVKVTSQTTLEAHKNGKKHKNNENNRILREKNKMLRQSKSQTETSASPTPVNPPAVHTDPSQQEVVEVPPKPTLMNPPAVIQVSTNPPQSITVKDLLESLTSQPPRSTIPLSLDKSTPPKSTKSLDGARPSPQKPPEGVQEKLAAASHEQAPPEVIAIESTPDVLDPSDVEVSEGGKDIHLEEDVVEISSYEDEDLQREGVKKPKGESKAPPAVALEDSEIQPVVASAPKKLPKPTVAPDLPRPRAPPEDVEDRVSQDKKAQDDGDRHLKDAGKNEQVMKGNGKEKEREENKDKRMDGKRVEGKTMESEGRKSTGVASEAVVDGAKDRRMESAGGNGERAGHGKPGSELRPDTNKGNGRESELEEGEAEEDEREEGERNDDDRRAFEKGIDQGGTAIREYGSAHVKVLREDPRLSAAAKLVPDALPPQYPGATRKFVVIPRKSVPAPPESPVAAPPWSLPHLPPWLPSSGSTLMGWTVRHHNAAEGVSTENGERGQDRGEAGRPESHGTSTGWQKQTESAREEGLSRSSLHSQAADGRGSSGLRSTSRRGPTYDERTSPADGSGSRAVNRQSSRDEEGRMRERTSDKEKAYEARPSREGDTRKRQRSDSHIRREDRAASSARESKRTDGQGREARARSNGEAYREKDRSSRSGRRSPQEDDYHQRDRSSPRVEPGLRERDSRDRDSRDRDPRDRDSRDRDPRDRDPRDRDPRDRGPRDRDPRGRGPRDRDPRDRGPRDRGPRDRDPRDRDPRDRDPRDRDSRARRSPKEDDYRPAERSSPRIEPSLRDRDSRDRTSRERSAQDRSSQDRKVQERDARRYQQDGARQRGAHERSSDERGSRHAGDFRERQPQRESRFSSVPDVRERERRDGKGLRIDGLRSGSVAAEGRSLDQISPTSPKSPMSTSGNLDFLKMLFEYAQQSPVHMKAFATMEHLLLNPYQGIPDQKDLSMLEEALSDVPLQEKRHTDGTWSFAVEGDALSGALGDIALGVEPLNEKMKPVTELIDVHLGRALGAGGEEEAGRLRDAIEEEMRREKQRDPMPGITGPGGPAKIRKYGERFDKRMPRPPAQVFPVDPRNGHVPGAAQGQVAAGNGGQNARAGRGERVTRVDENALSGGRDVYPRVPSWMIERDRRGEGAYLRQRSNAGQIQPMGVQYNYLAAAGHRDAYGNARYYR